VNQGSPDGGDIASGVQKKPRDDIILPFQVEPHGLRGGFVRLGDAVETVLAAHNYPEPVARLLAEMLALAPCLAGALKYKGVFTLQVKGNGPVKTLMADVTSEGGLRGYASYDAEAVEAVAVAHGADAPLQRLTEGGYIAFTVDQGLNADRYQGIVELSGATLAECTHAYFRNSEQLETGVKVAAGRSPTGTWRAAALMVQRLGFAGGENIPTGINEDDYDEGWRTAVVLMSSCTSAELLDDALAPEALLYRLFHETGVRVYPDRRLVTQCRCSVDKVENVLRSLTAKQLEDMTVDGEVSVVCEFCKTELCYNGDSLAALRGTFDNAGRFAPPTRKR
jgi:molecular chaperone Hsp33